MDCQICGYELCIISKDIQIDLNLLITNIVTSLQQNSIGRHTHNSAYSSTSTAHYKGVCFPDSICLHANIKDSALSITCTPIKIKIIIHMNCDLGFCGKFTNYIIPDE